MKKIEAQIVADSINPQGNRITSFLLTYPRFIHGELMTHRMFSRNSASSRAIPFKKMVEMVEEDPFIPIAWQKDHKGMQGNEYETDPEVLRNYKEVWLSGRNAAVGTSKTLHGDFAVFGNTEDSYKPLDLKLTKQLCNRLLEPYMWHTTLVTTTEINNFFELRCPQYNYLFDFYKSRKEVLEKSTNGKYNDGRDLSTFTDIDWLEINASPAEIHIQALAEAMWDAYNESKPNQLFDDDWHIPFGDKIDVEKLKELENKYQTKDRTKLAIKVCVARCARLSYMTFEGKIDYEKDIALHDQLLAAHHMSPFEHCCRVLTEEEYNTLGKIVLHSENEYIFEKGWVDNFKGFISYRRILKF